MGAGTTFLVSRTIIIVRGRNSTMRYIILLALFVSSNAFSDEIYKWVDEKGRVHYGDRESKPKDTEVELLDIKVNTYKSVSIGETTFIREKVTMYSTSWCGYCKRAKRYFIDNAIPFVEYDIEKNAKAQREYQKLGASGVPVILFKKRRLNGFSADAFDSFYNEGK